MVNDRASLSQQEHSQALAVAKVMTGNAQKQMQFMITRVGSDKDGCWNRCVRQAVENFKKFPTLYGGNSQFN